MTPKSTRWRSAVLSMVAATTLGLWGTQACALSLGSIAVMSSLGEPLRAEIDILDINADEAASLKLSVAQPEAFRAAGLEYNTVMTGLQITRQQRADGRSYLRISSPRAINDLFVDLVLEATWATGRITRDYTMLFDPPNLPAQVVTPSLAQISPVPATAAAPVPVAAIEEAPTPSPSAPEPLEATPASAPETAADTATATPDPTPEPPTGSQPSPAVAAQVPAKAPAPAARSTSVTVKSGDTASKIALAHMLPTGASLDQMLVALLRANPDAVIHGNINRIRAGAVLRLPSAEQALAIAPDQARQVLVVQSKDFNDFRQKLAASAPVRLVATAERRASGSVQASVKDRKAGAAAPDKLTLSKGATPSQTSEDGIAKERANKDAASLSESVSKNIAELTKLQASVASANPASTAATTQAAAATPVVSASAMPPATPASGIAASLPPKRPIAPPAPLSEPSLFDEMLDNPLIPFAAGGLVLTLAGLGTYRIRQRKKMNQMDDDGMPGQKPGFMRKKK